MLIPRELEYLVHLPSHWLQCELESICYPPLTCESRPASPSAVQLRLEWGESRDAVACAQERRAGQPLTGHQAQQYMLHCYIERIQNEASWSNVAIQLHFCILHHAHQCMLRSTSYYILYSQPWQHSTLIIHPTFFMLCSMLSITFIFFICNIYHHTKCLWGCYSSSKVYARDTAFTVKSFSDVTHVILTQDGSELLVEVHLA